VALGEPFSQQVQSLTSLSFCASTFPYFPYCASALDRPAEMDQIMNPPQQEELISPHDYSPPSKKSSVRQAKA
jgi:hypothetical protein